MLAECSRDLVSLTVEDHASTPWIDLGFLETPDYQGRFRPPNVAMESEAIECFAENKIGPSAP